MTHVHRIIAIGATLLAFTGTVQAQQAGDPALGKRKALQCQGCHGLTGISRMPDAPTLAGQREAYLVKALIDFKEGRHHNESMNVMAQMLSEQEIRDVAAYYASFEIEIKPKAQ